MMVQHFIEEYSNLTPARQKKGLEALFALIARDVEDHAELIGDILALAADVEHNDGFGTEGADI